MSWRLAPGASVGQTLAAPRQAVAGFRIKVQRFGHPPAIEYRLGTAWGARDVASGRIEPRDVDPYFERWVGADFPPRPPGSTGPWYLRLRVPQAVATGYYEVFGTSAVELPRPEFKARFQYVPTWGEAAARLAVFENPVNVDYGARTPAYGGGTALAADGTPLDPLDLAFQLVGPPGAGVRTPAVEERFAFVDELNAAVHAPLAPDERPAEPGEIRLTTSWSIVSGPLRDPLVAAAAADFRDFMERSLGVRVGVRTVGRLAPVERHRRAIVVSTRADCAAFAAELDRSESFSVDARDDRVVICGYDGRGVLRGLQFLEDELRLRGAPLLRPRAESRRPSYGPRLTCAPYLAKTELDASVDPYTDNLLWRISHSGFSAIWIWGEIGDVARSEIYP
ncbi:MAG: hypothetical protein FJ104_12475, partial [Deltaproteobacteria bacterium]|nr:hypothetical protein [Deltaproteobacteria bacterium]